jgi:hypothetical protein
LGHAARVAIVETSARTSRIRFAILSLLKMSCRMSDARGSGRARESKKLKYAIRNRTGQPLAFSSQLSAFRFPFSHPSPRNHPPSSA